MGEKSSYSQILKSSSIMGGAAGINMMLGMVRTKFAAVLIGTTGIGFLTSLTAIQGFIGIIAGLGIQTSAVREVAVAVGKQDDEAVGRAVLTLRRMSWFTGLIGMFAMMLFSPFLSQIIFNSAENTLDIATLGIVILLTNLSGGQMALIQGMRRIGDMARANIIAAVFATVSAIGFYSLLGMRGIVPSLIAISAVTLMVSWYFARRVPVPKVELSWKETFYEASGMVKLGVVFMWTGLMSSVVGLITVSLITQQVSLEAVGIYSAAFTLSGLFANFILQAMGADYYPHLTSIAGDRAAVNRLVNQQTEIGILLALPGLLATMVLAPWVIKIFYTHDFLPAVELMQWFLLGVFGRVISWPLGFIMLAMKKNKLYFFVETSIYILHIVLIILGLTVFDLAGVAMAFALLYLVYTAVVYRVSYNLTKFFWSQQTKKLLLTVVLTALVVFIMLLSTPFWFGEIFGILVMAIASFVSICGVLHRVDKESKVSKYILKIPGTLFLCKKDIKTNNQQGFR